MGGQQKLGIAFYPENTSDPDLICLIGVILSVYTIAWLTASFLAFDNLSKFSI